MMTEQKARPLVDEKSFDLAEHFLQGEPNVTDDDKWELAGLIQDAVEGFFRFREHAVTVAAEGDEDDDPTPWCHACGAKQKADCHCGPIAENE